MKKTILTILFIAITAYVKAGDLFNIPDDWVELAGRQLDVNEVLALEQYSTTDREIQVTIIKSLPVKSEHDKIDSVAGMIKGMQNKGFQYEFTKSGSFRGHESIHVRGVFNITGYDGVFLADNYVIFADDAMIMFAVSAAESRGGRELGLELLERIKLDEVAKITSDPIKVSHSKLWQYLGMFISIISLSALACFLTNRNKTRT